MKKLSPYVKDFIKKADMTLLILCLVSAIFGMVMIASASASLQNPARYLIVQIVCLLIGLGLFVLFTVLDIDIITDKWAALIIFEVALVLLLLTPLGYADNTGNRAWLRFGFVGVQPAEVIKVVFIIVLAKQLNYLKNYKNLNSAFSIAQLLIYCGFTVGLIVVVSKDMGSALVFLFIFLIMLFAAGVRFYWFIVGLAATAAVTPLVWTHVLNQRYRDRILAPYDASIDPNGFEIRWQANQSKIALASGRLTGTGLFKGRQTQSGAIPEKQTDFIFSVIGEELGMIACIIVILLLLAIIFRCIYVGIKSRNTMSMLICFGVAAWLIFQTFENIGMCIGIAPVIGLTLPFFSYGGSSLFSIFAAMGLVSGIKYRPKPERFRSLN
ncbi:MAG: FtsW/RodA/SpoVE family cell cycle protein [Oscillospiraceae bacterium]